MIESFTVRNFRLFRSCCVEPLRRVNLFVGKNNSGKSALLEAVQIYAAGASGALLWNLLHPRHESWHGDVESVGEDEIGSPIRHLFRNHRLPGPGEEGLRLGPTEGSTGSLHIHTAAYLRELDEEEGVFTRTRVEPEDLAGIETDLDLLLVADDGERTRILLNLQEFRRGPMRPHALRRGVEERLPVQFVPTRAMESREIAALWDLVGLTPLEPKVIEGLRLIDPSIEDIAFVEDLSRRPGQNRIPLARTTEFDEPVPLNSLGDGVSRLFQIILALVSARDGVLLVDEFENGLHWSVQAQVWALVFRLAKDLKVQVFATTHSRDCVKGFEEAWADHASEGSFHRLVREGDGKVLAVDYDQETLSDAVDTEVEVR